jgi:hypothetical protein
MKYDFADFRLGSDFEYAHELMQSAFRSMMERAFSEVLELGHWGNGEKPNSLTWAASPFKDYPSIFQDEFPIEITYSGDDIVNYIKNGLHFSKVRDAVHPQTLQKLREFLSTWKVAIVEAEALINETKELEGAIIS